MSKNKNKNNHTELHSFIAEGASIQGELNTVGSIRIEGEIKGTISTNEKLVTGNSSKVIGDVTAKNADIEGIIEGNISISEKLVLKKGSKVLGDIVSNTIIIEDGAFFTGKCEMQVQLAADSPE